MQPRATTAMRDCRALAPAAPLDLAIDPPVQRALGSTRIARFAGAGPWREEGGGVCRIVFQCTSRSLVTLGGRAPDCALSAGHWLVRGAPALEVRGWWSSEVILLAFPAGLLSRALSSQVQAAPAGAVRTGGAARMCLELARTCLAQADPVSDAVNATLGDAIVDLAKLALIEQSCGKRGETIRETVRTRILGFVHRNLADPDLTIERIAERMHCTKRYLHKVFSENGETLNQYIWARRLDLCRAHLVRADLAGKSITEIAFACGFSNAAHFSRSFRSRFGQSPRAFRRGALEG